MIVFYESGQLHEILSIAFLRHIYLVCAKSVFFVAGEILSCSGAWRAVFAGAYSILKVKNVFKVSTAEISPWNIEVGRSSVERNIWVSEFWNYLFFSHYFLKHLHLIIRRLLFTRLRARFGNWREKFLGILNTFIWGSRHLHKLLNFCVVFLEFLCNHIFNLFLKIVDNVLYWFHFEHWFGPDIPVLLQGFRDWNSLVDNLVCLV